jgi:hypothetical protein
MQKYMASPRAGNIWGGFISSLSRVKKGDILNTMQGLLDYPLKPALVRLNRSGIRLTAARAADSPGAFPSSTRTLTGGRMNQAIILLNLSLKSNCCISTTVKYLVKNTITLILELQAMKVNLILSEADQSIFPIIEVMR